MEKIIELQSSNIWITLIDIAELKEQDKNARVMSKEMFSQLQKNIQDKGGLLESLPYCAETEKGIEIVSGHHRVRASRAAGIQKIHIILDCNNLSKDEIVSKQLSHNAISGIDDEQLLLELYESIKDVDQRIATFIDADEIKSLIPTEVGIGELGIGLDFKTVNLLFLPHQLKEFNLVIDMIEKGEGVIVSDLEHWDDFKVAVNRVRETENIKSVGMALSKMCKITKEYYEKEKEKED